MTFIAGSTRRQQLPSKDRRRSILTRKRFQFVGALVIAVLLPWWLRPTIGGRLFEAASTNAFVANMIAGKKMKPDKAAETWVKANTGKVNAWLGK